MHKRKVEFFAFFQYFQVGEPNFRYSLFSLGKQYLLLSNALQFLKIEEFRDRKKNSRVVVQNKNQGLANFLWPSKA